MTTTKLVSLIRSGHTRESAQSILAAIDMLREALKPFADLLEDSEDYLEVQPASLWVYPEDVIKAKEALKATE